MKKLICVLLCLIFLLSFSIPAYALWPFASPTPTPAPAELVNCLTNCYFFYDSAASRYVLLFSLLDKQDEPLAVPCTAEVSIKSESGEILFESKRSVTANGYKFWPLSITQSIYAAAIQIDTSLIKPTASGKGAVSCRVYSEGYFSFQPFTIDFNGLPQLDPASLCTLTLPDCPLDLSYYSYDGSVRSKVCVNNIVYLFEPYFNTGNVRLSVTFYGEKIAEGKDIPISHNFRWKLYDSDGYLVDSSIGFLSGLSVGDKFRDECITIYGLPVDDYRLEILDYQ